METKEIRNLKPKIKLQSDWSTIAIKKSYKVKENYQKLQ